MAGQSTAPPVPVASGWNQVRRAYLAAPWDAFWIECYANLPFGVWMDLDKAVRLAQREPGIENIEPLVPMLGRIVLAHNILDTDGNPLAFELRVMSGSLIGAIAAAVSTIQNGGGTAVVTELKRAPSLN